MEEITISCKNMQIFEKFGIFILTIVSLCGIILI